MKFETELKYCEWFAALKLGCKGQTMASPNYSHEISKLHVPESVLKFSSDNLQEVIKIQTPSNLQKSIDPRDHPDFEAKHYVPRRLLRKLGAQMSRSISSHNRT